MEILWVLLAGWLAHNPHGDGEDELRIPRTWVESELEAMELPLARPEYTPQHVTADYYYSIPVRPVYRGYPVYHPDREPPGYMEWLRQREPEVVFEASILKTEADWIEAGELVFNAPILFDAFARLPLVRERSWYDAVEPPLAEDGTLPSLQYVIRTRGQVEVGVFACTSCHTRVQPDGTVISGAQGNFPVARAAGWFLRNGLDHAPDREAVTARARNAVNANYTVPWLAAGTPRRIQDLSIAEVGDLFEAIPPGVNARGRATPWAPTKAPSLIGVRNRRFLDHTAVQEQRSLADLMRYAALNQGADLLASYGGHIPFARKPGQRPPPAVLQRYSDKQLYALAKFIYSLKPPRNPNPVGEQAQRGREVFESERCDACHTPPLYTNNRLIAADGFKVPEDHRAAYDVMTRKVGTDPELAMETLRGTGYYKIPTLLGVWYRGPFGHSGSVATLEDWFDPDRLSKDYERTGFRGAFGEKHAVPGHHFGLELSEQDRAALIAFLKTL